MSSLKRSHPEDDDSSSISPASAVKLVLAPREMFFSIPLRTLAVRGQSIQALSSPCGGHALANTRIAATASLNSLQRASLTSMLTILNDYFPDDDSSKLLTLSLADISQTNDATLSSMADTIDLGLIAFLAKGGGQHSTPDQDPEPAISAAESSSSATAVAHKRARVSNQSGRSTRSQKVKNACIARDGDRCRLCNLVECVSAHILPFSLHGRKTVNFWSFVSMFRGADGTASLKAAALSPDPDNADNILNVIQLCRNCHNLLDKSLLTLVPQIVEDPATVFPYDPHAVRQYGVVAEFPAGLQRAIIPILQDDGELHLMRPGQVLTLCTADPILLPLPHPLLFQLHVICSRMVIMRAAAGYPVLSEHQSDGDTLFDPLDVGDQTDDGECFGERGGKDEPRDPAVVVKELGQRKLEQEQLLQKIRKADSVRPGVAISLL